MKKQEEMRKEDETYYDGHPFYCPYGTIMARDMEIWKRRHEEGKQ